MKILYFAWVREKVGRDYDEIDLPANLKTVTDLIAWLKTTGPEFEIAFENEKSIRTAINQTHVSHDASLEGAHEIAFFPPVTGG